MGEEGGLPSAKRRGRLVQCSFSWIRPVGDIVTSRALSRSIQLSRICLSMITVVRVTDDSTTSVSPPLCGASAAYTTVRKMIAGWSLLTESMVLSL